MRYASNVESNTVQVTAYFSSLFNLCCFTFMLCCYKQLRIKEHPIKQQLYTYEHSVKNVPTVLQKMGNAVIIVNIFSQSPSDFLYESPERSIDLWFAEYIITQTSGLNQ